MGKVFVRMVIVVAVVLACSGCTIMGYKTATQRQLDHIKRISERPHTYEDNMVNNAVLANMSLAEFHFIPHSKELSGSGVVRLDRMAPMLDSYGGTVRYGADISDEELVEQRIATVHDYLSMTGCNMDRVVIEPGLPGGQGMPARRALEKQHRMDNPQDQNRGAPMLALPTQ